MFKEAPALTPRVRDRITRDVSDFAYFVSSLDLDVPKSTPPIGINAGSTGGSSGFATGAPVYYGSIMLGEKALRSQDSITASYSGFVFNQMVLKGDFTKNTSSRLRIGVAASIYYNWSFWDRRGGSPERWADIFWKIRERVNKRFADSLMAYTIKVMLDDQAPNKTAREDETDKVVDNYIFQKISTADLIVDSPNGKMPVIIDIVKSSPVQVNLPETN